MHPICNFVPDYSSHPFSKPEIYPSSRNREGIPKISYGWNFTLVNKINRLFCTGKIRPSKCLILLTKHRA
jgi:hypothetical protein